MEQNKSLGLLSLARKGGNIVLGEEQAGAAARASRARLMLLASDAGGHTVRRAKSSAATWVPIMLSNKYNLLDVLREHIHQLQIMRRMIERDDAEGLKAAFDRANSIQRIIH